MRSQTESPKVNLTEIQSCPPAQIKITLHSPNSPTGVLAVRILVCKCLYQSQKCQNPPFQGCSKQKSFCLPPVLDYKCIESTWNFLIPHFLRVQLFRWHSGAIAIHRTQSISPRFTVQARPPRPCAPRGRCWRLCPHGSRAPTPPGT